MATALYTVRCRTRDDQSLPDAVPALIAAGIGSYRGKSGKKTAPPVFLETFPKSVRPFTAGAHRAAVASAAWATERSRDAEILDAVTRTVTYKKKGDALAGVDLARALEAMRTDPAAAERAGTHLGKRCLYWTHYLLHLGTPNAFAAPRGMTALALDVETAYSPKDQPLPTHPEDQKSLLFRILALLGGREGAASALEEAAGARWNALKHEAFEVFEDVDVSKPKAAGKLASGEPKEKATYSVLLFTHLVGPITEGQLWETTAYGGVP